MKEMHELVAYLVKMSKMELVMNRDAGEEEDEGIWNKDTEDVNYIQGNYKKRGFHQNYRSHPNFSYQSPNVENPQDQIYPKKPRNFAGNFKGKNFGVYNAAPKQQFTSQESKLESMMHQLMENQKKSVDDINIKVDGMYSSLNRRIETVSMHVKVLENQLAHIASKSKTPFGALPRKSKDNPQEQVNMTEFGSWFSFGATDRYNPMTNRYTPTFSTDQ